MKNIGKFFATVCFALAATTAVNAQDLNQATELYNQAAQAVETDKAGALENFQKALDMANALGEEGAALASDIKKLIPQILLQISKEDAAAKNIDSALENLAKTEAKAKEFGIEDLTADINELYSQIYMMQANDALNAKSFEAAAAAYQKVTEYDPANATAFLRLGMAQDKLGQEELAVAAMEQASLLGEEEAATKQLGKMFLMKANKAYRSKQLDVALEAIQKSLGYQPENAQANMLYGTIAFAKKDFNKAIEGLEKFLTLKPNDKNKNGIIYQIAASYEALGQNAKAKSYYEQIVNDPKFAEFAKHKVSTL